MVDVNSIHHGSWRMMVGHMLHTWLPNPAGFGYTTATEVLDGDGYTWGLCFNGYSTGPYLMVDPDAGPLIRSVAPMRGTVI